MRYIASNAAEVTLSFEYDELSFLTAAVEVASPNDKTAETLRRYLANAISESVRDNLNHWALNNGLQVGVDIAVAPKKKGDE